MCRLQQSLCDDRSGEEVSTVKEVRLQKFRKIYNELARGKRISWNDLKFALQKAVSNATVTDEQASTQKPKQRL